MLEATTSSLAIVHPGVKPQIAILPSTFFGQNPVKDQALLNNLDGIKDMKRIPLQDLAFVIKINRNSNVFKNISK